MSDANGTQAGATGQTFTLADIEKERAHAQHFKQLADENAQKLKSFEGVDPEDYRKSKAELEEIKKKAALGDPAKLEEWQKSKEDEIRKQVQKDLDDARSTAEKLSKQNKELTVTDKVFASVAQRVTQDLSGFIKEQIRAHGDLDAQGNIVFKGEDGKPLYAPGSTTQLMTVEQFGEYLSNKYPSAFTPLEKGGTKQGGERANTGGSYSGKVLSRAEIQALSSAEQKEYFRKNPQVTQDFLSGRLK